MSKEILAGNYAADYEKKAGLDVHPKTASFHGFLAGYEAAETRNAELEERNKKLMELLEVEVKAKGWEFYLRECSHKPKSGIHGYDEITYEAWNTYKQANGI